MHEQGESPVVIDVESTINPNINRTTSRGQPYEHQTDIMLGALYPSEEAFAIELKSFQRGARNTNLEKRLKTWKYSKGNNSHKQFYLDRVALQNNGLGGFQWYFQRFNVKQPSSDDYDGPTTASLQQVIRPALVIKPKPAVPVGSDTNAAARVDIFTLKTAFLYNAGIFFDGIASDTLQDWFTNLN